MTSTLAEKQRAYAELIVRGGVNLRDGDGLAEEVAALPAGAGPFGDFGGGGGGPRGRRQRWLRRDAQHHRRAADRRQSRRRDRHRDPAGNHPRPAVTAAASVTTTRLDILFFDGFKLTTNLKVLPSKTEIGIQSTA